MLFVVTGTESSGKTSLVEALAKHLKAPGVTETSRVYLQGRVGYQPSDLLQIAQQQQAAEGAVLASAPTLAIADTDLQVVYIWWQERFGPAPEVLQEAYAQQSPRHYLLCKPDLPWEADPLRENPADRERLWEVYRQDLSARQLAFSIIEGVGQQRLDNALRAIRQVLSGAVQ
ncbi:MAG: ATP-binding protein [Pseudomonadaceae bacterium]|nr:ATP-binding protein [Pseudomonadaceae bacterium]